MKNLVLSFFLIAAFVFPSIAQTNTKQPDATTQTFITNATVGGLKEIKTGKLATQKAKNAGVKAFGNRMITDHTKANAQLMQIVKSEGYQITPPSPSSVADDPMLKQSSGAAFDKNYVSMMVTDHQKTIDLFQTYATSGTDAKVKAFAVQTLPKLKAHLASIKAIAAKMNVSASM